MICPKCKGNTRDDSVFCTKCGCKISNYKEVKKNLEIIQSDNNSYKDSDNYKSTCKNEYDKKTKDNSSEEIIESCNQENKLVSLSKENYNTKENKSKKDNNIKTSSSNEQKDRKNDKIFKYFIIGMSIFLILFFIAIITSGSNDDYDDYSYDTSTKTNDTIVSDENSQDLNSENTNDINEDIDSEEEYNFMNDGYESEFNTYFSGCKNISTTDLNSGEYIDEKVALFSTINDMDIDTDSGLYIFYLNSGAIACMSSSDYNKTAPVGIGDSIIICGIVETVDVMDSTVPVLHGYYMKYDE